MTCKTNVVLLTDCLGGITGGAEKQIFELARRLPKDQYNVFVASMEAQGETSKPLIESIGCQLHVFRVIRIYGLSGFIQGLKFCSFLRQNSIDSLMTYHFGSDIWGTFWGHLAGVRNIVSNRRDMGFWRNQSHVMAYKLINGWVNTIVTVTASIKQMALKTEGVSGNKVHVIYNGVDLVQKSIDGSKNRANLKLNQQDIIIMHVANLRPVKGHKYLIEAFAKAAQRFTDIKLVLVGKDELNGQLQSHAETLGIKDKILFLGQRTDITELLAVSDICVLPSLSEGMSNAILEYMTFAKPVIATNVGGNPELIQNGHNGLLVEKENSEQLAEALMDLIGNKEKRQAMGQNGLLRVKSEFSMEAMMAQYESLFKGTKRVLHLVSSGGLFGAERVILNLASQDNSIISWVGAINNKHNPHLEIIQEAQNTGLKSAIFDSCAQADVNTIYSIKKFLKENNIDIIHTHNYKSDTMGFLATRFTRVKWVSTIHGWIGTDSKLRWYEVFDRYILKIADKVICVSQNNYDMLLKKGFNKKSLAIIPNGTNLKQFSSVNPDQALKKNLCIDINDIVIGIVGRLDEEKGHHILLKALALMIPQYPGFKCLIIGDGPLKMKLQEQTNALNLSGHIVFTGNRKDMPDIYKICDILVNSSFTEGLPMTILEAMASHLPVIATNVGGVGKVIKNQENGILLEAGNPDTLAAAILELIRDEQKRKNFAQKAYQLVCDSYSNARMAGEYQEIYTSI